MYIKVPLLLLLLDGMRLSSSWSRSLEIDRFASLKSIDFSGSVLSVTNSNQCQILIRLLGGGHGVSTDLRGSVGKEAVSQILGAKLLRALNASMGTLNYCISVVVQCSYVWLEY